ncbi:augmin complex subunit dgt4 [Ceratitis capitata]|uniref:Augmin complex subunit dgt4 n=1 Tax=Ceratitis capitata TaxID=7213 RepID=W8C4H5_CERCA|nr:augmin complex subunit dgt4 [Ceratitis capitata]
MSANNATPTSSNSLGSNSPSVTSSGTDDIQYLLYLEALRRFRDDETNIKRQVDEKNRQYLEAKEEYLQLYSKYVKLTTLAATRCALLTDNHLPSAKISEADKEIAAIAHKLSSGDVIETINASEVEECKTKLAACEKHDNLKKLCDELAESKATVRAVQSSTETVEATIETATLQSLDYFVEEVGRRN